MTKFRAGESVQVVADCGIRNDDDSDIPSVELRGTECHVAGANSTYTAETGETMVGVTVDDGGGLTAIPERALRSRSRSTSVGWSRRFADGWSAIFRR